VAPAIVKLLTCPSLPACTLKLGLNQKKNTIAINTGLLAYTFTTLGDSLTNNDRDTEIPELLPDSRVTVRQHFFSVRVVQLWNKLPEEVVSAGSVSAFISRLNLMHISFFNVLF